MAPARISTSVGRMKSDGRAHSTEPAVLGGARVTKPALKKRVSKNERVIDHPHEVENNLVDSLRPGLILVLIGLNPGLETARTGSRYDDWPESSS